MKSPLPGTGGSGDVPSIAHSHTTEKPLGEDDDRNCSAPSRPLQLTLSRGAPPNISPLNPKANKSQYKPADWIVVVALNAAERDSDRVDSTSSQGFTEVSGYAVLESKDTFCLLPFPIWFRAPELSDASSQAGPSCESSGPTF